MNYKKKIYKLCCFLTITICILSFKSVSINMITKSVSTNTNIKNEINITENKIRIIDELTEEFFGY